MPVAQALRHLAVVVAVVVLVLLAQVTVATMAETVVLVFHRQLQAPQ